jgi:hypothetical protein
MDYTNFVGELTHISKTVQKVTWKQWKRRLKPNTMTKKSFPAINIFLVAYFLLVTLGDTVNANSNNKCGDIKIGDLVV